MAGIHSVLVTGAWRGIGLEFTKQFLTNPDFRAEIVIATCLVPAEAKDLLELQEKHSALHILELDVTKFDTFNELVNKVQAIVGHRGLTLLINNAGIGSPMHKLESIDADRYISVLKTNTVGPVLLTKALLPLLRQSASVNAARCHDRLSITRAAVINITSIFASILQTGSDKTMEKVRAYGYRESKTALNMATQLMSRELEEDGILVESIHPGFVITDMTAQLKATTTTETSVTSMLKTMLDFSEKNKIGFRSYDGEIIPF
nr:PREDICTED: uncharacterized protein LOC109043321 [Bemisia tabaci]